MNTVGDKNVSKIIKVIEDKGKIRPVELCRALNISAQAIHRHLRNLIERGVLETRGSAPFTRYVLAGVPDFEAAADWVNARTAPKSPESVCETRDVFTARLPRLKDFVGDGLSEAILPMVVSTAGEVGNNSFDHNLGQWRDVPGCWFESQVTGRRLWILIGDRGQGVFQSLIKVHPHLGDEQAALNAAFETVISGRAPEKRGNGLKFVRTTVSAASGAGIACISGAGRVAYGEGGERCAGFLDKKFINVKGTVTLMVWGLR